MNAATRWLSGHGRPDHPTCCRFVYRRHDRAERRERLLSFRPSIALTLVLIDSMNLRTRAWIWPAGFVALALFIASVLYSAHSTAAPSVTWTPSSITQE